jgi:hypothetical protein
MCQSRNGFLSKTGLKMKMNTRADVLALNPLMAGLLLSA